MKFTLTTRRCELTDRDRELLDHHLKRLEPELKHFDPDLVHLTVDIERHARREEYTGRFRLAVMSTVLPVRRNVAPTLPALLKLAFNDLHEQLHRFKSQLRRDYLHERRRTSLPPELVAYQERVLLDERELLDRALSGDRAAFDALVNHELPELTRAIERLLREHGREATAEAVEHVMADVLTTAFTELARKPARWSMAGWLAWLARRIIRRDVTQEAVAQSQEHPSHAG
ncbi:MAG: hypothetical protein C4290_01730 [Chloroflexota bacterium]